MRLVQRNRWEPKPEREKVAFPLTPMPYRSYEPAERSVDYKERHNNRLYMPYQAGDVVFINIGSTSMPQIRIGRIVRCFTEYMERSDWYIPKYRVQLATKDGYWSAQWRYCWPGDIYRAYHASEDNELRALPHVIEKLADLCPAGDVYKVGQPVKAIRATTDEKIAYLPKGWQEAKIVKLEIDGITVQFEWDDVRQKLKIEHVMPR